MREITTHKINGCNEAITITADDKPGDGGASHLYALGFDNWRGHERHVLHFQEGTVAEAGMNGITNEALLAVLIDRLHGFQYGPYRCYDNEVALQSLRRAMGALHDRTRKRLARGVEGTHTP